MKDPEVTDPRSLHNAEVLFAASAAGVWRYSLIKPKASGVERKNQMQIPATKTRQPMTPAIAKGNG
ncbi:MAG TPA: hypothetical protein VEI58_03175 [Chthoniobacterales bacterium]|nr:hypothetical protein [Chthoniobacterales bacterium]